MRTIKFRMWDSEKKKIRQVDELGFSNAVWNFEHSSTGAGDTLYEASEIFPIMQFTGLLDKNGKEIYESDTVRYTPKFQADPVLEFTVIWADGSFVEQHSGTLSDGSFLRNKALVEVIGNKYEN